jgi:Alw26I/Eco31I/Esp3I family type II restriction m6 adenine DNA methyltransferase
LDHLTYLKPLSGADESLSGLLTKAAGRFYTHGTIGRAIAARLWGCIEPTLESGATVSVIDPFAGDGRLVAWFLSAAANTRPDVRWDVHLWDIDRNGLGRAKRILEHHLGGLIANTSLTVVETDTFRFVGEFDRRFDVVITNPPWDVLKPDRRELAALGQEDRENYVSALSSYAAFLQKTFQFSKPTGAFRGWATQLSRVGTEVALRLTRHGGFSALVIPASFFADQRSETLRAHLTRECEVKQVELFPAEMRLFGGADVTTATLIVRRISTASSEFQLIRHQPKGDSSVQAVQVDHSRPLNIPVSFGRPGRFEARFGDLSSFGDLQETSSLWSGRELDETRLSEKLTVKGPGAPFLKGRMIGRLKSVQPEQFVSPEFVPKAPSVGLARIVWRDVSRPSQKRRLIATLIPAGWVTGNSLGIACFRDRDPFKTRALLGLMLSIPFEYQLRGLLSTGHVTLGSVRRVKIPSLHASPAMNDLVKAVEAGLGGAEDWEYLLEAAAARVYRLERSELSEMLEEFSKITSEERARVLDCYDRERR